MRFEKIALIQIQQYVNPHYVTTYCNCTYKHKALKLCHTTDDVTEVYAGFFSGKKTWGDRSMHLTAFLKCQIRDDWMELFLLDVLQNFFFKK